MPVFAGVSSSGVNLIEPESTGIGIFSLRLILCKWWQPSWIKYYGDVILAIIISEEDRSGPANFTHSNRLEIALFGTFVMGYKRQGRGGVQTRQADYFQAVAFDVVPYVEAVVLLVKL